MPQDDQSRELTPEEMFEATDEGNAPAEQTPAAAEPKEEAEQHFEYEALGATRKEPLSLVLKRASQGYDYAQKMEQFKQQQAEVTQRQEAADELRNKYAQIDDYARENPDWYDHWSTAYDNRATNAVDQEQPAVDLSPVMQRIDAIENSFKGVQDHITQQKESIEDGKFWDEVKAVQKEYPDVDLKQSDEAGKTLEYKILQHATDNGIASFRVAFRDFYHDSLKTRAVEQAKQDLIAKDKDNRKKGIVGVSNTPMLSSEMPNLRGMHENDILQAAINEYNEME